MSLKCKGGLFDAGIVFRNGERKWREDDYACVLKVYQDIGNIAI